MNGKVELLESIAEWERKLALVQRHERPLFGSETCPLCRKFRQGAACPDCPVAAHTSKPACHDTPYDDICVYLADCAGESFLDWDKLEALVREELKFLRLLVTIDEESEALEQSIEHWEENLRRAIRGQSIHIGGTFCALCQYYIEKYGGCQSGCPVFKKTGRLMCMGTPFSLVWRNPTVDNIQKELVFLRSLRTKPLTFPVYVKWDTQNYIRFDSETSGRWISMERQKDGSCVKCDIYATANICSDYLRLFPDKQVTRAEVQENLPPPLMIKEVVEVERVVVPPRGLTDEEV